MKIKQVLSVVLISAVTAVASVWGYQRFAGSATYIYPSTVGNDTGKRPANYTRFNGIHGNNNVGFDFTEAANAAIPATVHIKTKSTRTASNNLPKRSPFGDLFPDLDDFFNDRSRSFPQSASGSGAIISSDGYIVTNNHVVDGADDITVTLSNKKSFTAKLIAADPSSDLAVIKIDAKELPFLLYGDSDEMQVGQWVLAIGYPLYLETTATAGIVSAKGRTLDINRRQSDLPVESFIQTDAAVNPGNSGGPLVNLEGKMLGINSAIASPTGSYAGYSFTIPVNIVKKIVADLIKHGTVQRAYLGIEYPRENLSDEVKAQNGIKGEEDGVFVLNARTEGAAAAAGIKKGDVITKINGVPVSSGADMVGQIATYRPGDKVNISYKRDGREITTNVTLRNSSGNTEMVRTSVMDKLGAELRTINKDEAKELGVNGGVEIKSINSRGLLSRVRVNEGYVITKVDGKEVKTVEELKKILESATGSVKFEGMYPGYDGIYPFVLNMNSAN